MRVLAALLVLWPLARLEAQTRLTVEQVVSFVRSSITLKQEDHRVAGYLRRVTLVERLDDRTIELLQGEGAA